MSVFRRLFSPTNVRFGSEADVKSAGRHSALCPVVNSRQRTRDKKQADKRPRGPWRHCDTAIPLTPNARAPPPCSSRISWSYFMRYSYVTTGLRLSRRAMRLRKAASRTFGARRFFELTFKPLNLRSGLIQFRLEVNALPIRLLKL